MGIEERIQQKTIDGVNYEVTPLTFGVGHKALVRFIKIAAPVMSAGMSKNVEGILSALPAALNEDDVSYFAKEFGARSRYQDGGRWVPLVWDNQEIHFAGRYSAFYGWMRFCIEVNFGGFFADLMRQVGSGASHQEVKAA